MDKIVSNGVFCPMCRSKDVECTNADMPAWFDDMLICTIEEHKCNACGHEFTIRGEYRMTVYNYDRDPCIPEDTDIVIGDEDKPASEEVRT